MDNNVNGNNGNMGGNPEGNMNNGVNFEQLSQIFEVINNLTGNQASAPNQAQNQNPNNGINLSSILKLGMDFAKAHVSNKHNDLQKLQDIDNLAENLNRDLDVNQKLALTFMISFMKPIVSAWELLGKDKDLEIGFLPNDESQNVLRAVYGAFFCFISDMEKFNALLELLPENTRKFFKEKKDVFLCLRREDFDAVTDILSDKTSLWKIYGLSDKFLKGELKFDDLKEAFWSNENTKGKADKCLCGAEITAKATVLILSCFTYIIFKVVNRVVSGKIDETKKKEYEKSRKQLNYLMKRFIDGLPLTEEEKKELKTLVKVCNELTKDVFYKLFRGEFREMNRHDLKQLIPTIFFCILCPFYFICLGIQFARVTIKLSEERAISKLVLGNLRKQTNDSLTSSNVPLLNDGNSAFGVQFDR